MVTIHLDADETYTVKEVTEIIGEVLDFVGQQADSNNLQYSASDVYWTLHDLLRYVNARMKGEFVLKRLKKGSWRLEYMTEEAAKRKADGEHRKEIRRTADYIEEMTGRRPPWG